jgi:hypothetical protein
MSALREFQSAFGAAVFEQRDAPLLALCAGDPTRAVRSLRAYRESVLTNLAGAVVATYPVIGRIVGTPFLRAAARRYALSRPSRSGDLNRYGDDFAAFLADFEPAASLPYLPDVARLEWAVQQVGAAADAPTPDLSCLSATAPEAWGALCFALAPAHAVLVSDWPLYDIWRVNQADFQGARQVDFDQAQGVLVHRTQRGDTMVTPLSGGAAILLGALGGGQCLLDALAAVPDTAELDLQNLLATLLGQGLVMRVYPG